MTSPPLILPHTGAIFNSWKALSTAPSLQLGLLGSSFLILFHPMCTMIFQAHSRTTGSICFGDKQCKSDRRWPSVFSPLSGLPLDSKNRACKCRGSHCSWVDLQQLRRDYGQRKERVPRRRIASLSSAILSCGAGGLCRVNLEIDTKASISLEGHWEGHHSWTPHPEVLSS